MKSVLFVVFAVGIAFVLAQDQKSDTLRAISDGLNKFSINLFKEFTAKEQKNLVFSPLSVHILLSEAAYGAKGKTFEEMKKSLGLPNDDSSGIQGFKDLMNYLNKLENVTLEVANTIYVSDKLSLKSEFKDLAKSYFQSYASELDFGKVQESVDIINDWVNQKTHNKIPKLIDEDFLDETTQMILLNAVYFKGGWFSEFKKNLTSDNVFYVNGKEEKKVPTMSMKDKFIYGELPKSAAKFIELPYKNDNLKMVIIVPDKIDGLKDLIKNIEYFDDDKIDESKLYREVTLYLPKFKIESTIPLENVLKKLGMEEMFSAKADFSKMSEQPMNVAKVLQKAMIEVNEEGSVAAAVTVGSMGLMSSLVKPKPVTLKIDRPFYYKIVDDLNNLILFQGIVQDPKY